MVAVPLPLLTNVTPVGRLPASLRVGAGVPVVVTVKEPWLPTVKLVLPPLVIDGATSMLKESVFEDVELTPAPLLVTLFETFPDALPDTFTSMVSEL